MPDPHEPAGPTGSSTTERPPAPQAQQQHQDRSGIDFELLWQQAPSAQLLLDDDGMITEVNDTFVRWTGHRREEVLATPFTGLLPIGDRIVYATHCVPQLMVTGHVSEASVQVLGADGTRHPALLSAARRRPHVQAATDATGDEGQTGPGLDGDGGGSEGGAQVAIVLVDARQRRRYEEQLLAQRREAEEARARIAAAEARLQALVHRDPLTGLLNRGGLLEALTAALSAPNVVQDEAQNGNGHRGARAHDSERQTTLVFIDLDGFKTVNDNLGHDAGDELLRIVADRIAGSWRAGGIVARLAGDEFVLVDDLAGEHVPQAAERLLEALSRPVVLHGVEVVVSASIGVASTGSSNAGGTERTRTNVAVMDTSLRGSGVDSTPPPDDDVVGTPVRFSPQVEAELLLRRADVAMYRAKAGGVGRFAVHRPGDADPNADRLVLLEQLRTALREDQLRVHYQPRIDLRSGAVRGVEALVRWEHPQRGLLSPVHFIDAAEQSGLIRDVGSWVLQRAVLQVAATQRMSHGERAGVPGDLQVSVNVSARQLTDPELPMRVASILAQAGLHAPRLVLEITETALMNQPETALVTLRRLKELGVLLAVDDFGTGYSSFTYLKQFPVDELKIDRSFVAGSTTDAGDAAIVASCIHLAHAMGKVAVAEGVETVAQHRALQALDCDQAQGYLFSQPLPWDDIRWTSEQDSASGNL